MKVAILTRDYPPTIGGIATHVEALTRSLRQLGVEAQVLVGRTDFRTLTLPLEMSSRDYDIVHVQSSPYGAFVSGSQLVVTVHAPVLTEWSHYATTSKVNSIPAFFCEKLTFRKARAILAVSAITKSELVTRYHLGAERVEVIGNGVDFEKFASSGQERAWNKVLLVSRLEPRKRVDVAIDALSKLDPSIYDAEIAGDGSQRSELEEMARSLHVNVRFLGKVGESELPSLYAEAGVFLTTSASEGFGLSLLEAMASGCGIIASNIPTHSELLKNGDVGLIYSSQQDLASKLSLLVGNSALISRLGAKAQIVAHNYTWDAVAKRVLVIYNSVLTGTR